MEIFKYISFSRLIVVLTSIYEHEENMFSSVFMFDYSDFKASRFLSGECSAEPPWIEFVSCIRYWGTRRSVPNIFFHPLTITPAVNAAGKQLCWNLIVLHGWSAVRSWRSFFYVKFHLFRGLGIRWDHLYIYSCIADLYCIQKHRVPIVDETPRSRRHHRERRKFSQVILHWYLRILEPHCAIWVECLHGRKRWALAATEPRRCDRSTSET